MSTVSTQVLESFTESLYARMSHLWSLPCCRNLYFSDSGKARLGQIVGWIWGLYQAGETQLAVELAADLDCKLKYMGEADCTVEVELANGNKVTVPQTKRTIHDDGTFSGLSFVCYHPVAPKVYAEQLAKAREQDPEGSEFAHAATAQRVLDIAKPEDMKQVFGSDLISYRYCDGSEHRVYYRRGYNGALTYDGPGCGETFSVSLTPVKYWGVHT